MIDLIVLKCRDLAYKKTHRIDGAVKIQMLVRLIHKLWGMTGLIARCPSEAVEHPGAGGRSG